MSALLITAITFYHLFHRSSPADVLAAGYLHVPPHLVDYAAASSKLFLILYHKDTPMPLAVMEEPLKVVVSNTTRSQGYRRYFAITQEKLSSMAAPSTLTSLLKTPHTKLFLKARFDRDGWGGRDQPGDLTSNKLSFLPYSQDLLISLDQKIIPPS